MLLAKERVKKPLLRYNLNKRIFKHLKWGIVVLFQLAAYDYEADQRYFVLQHKYIEPFWVQLERDIASDIWGLRGIIQILLNFIQL